MSPSSTTSSSQIPLSATNTPHAQTTSFGNFGGGLVEIAALTALIGSTTAESLVLGNRGAVGLLWGTMSIFGSLSVIKACLAASTPDWLRETFGVRNPPSDHALGMGLHLTNTAMRTRRRATGMCGLACRVSKGHASDKEGVDNTFYQDVYAYDQSSAGVLELLPEEGHSPGDPLSIYLFMPDVYSQLTATHELVKDWIGILASMLKIVEVVILYKEGAIKLALVGACSWLYFLLATALLQLKGISREYADGHVYDLMAGQMPTPVKPGGYRKILLGMPQNVRNSMFWRFAWALGGIVTTTTVVVAYIALGSYGMRVFAEWTGFQFLWLILRSVFYHYAETTDRVFNHPMLVKKNFHELEPSLRDRVRKLIQGLSLYQMHVHPRGLYCYDDVDRVIKPNYRLHDHFPLNSISKDFSSALDSTSVTISGVIGDTLLASATYVHGSKYVPLDLYDTCVVLIKTDHGDIAIPSARVLSGKPPPRDPNQAESGFELPLPPKGGSNRGRHDTTWWYWIPCGNNEWLEMHTIDMQIMGKRRARVVSDMAVTKRLLSGDLYVSISDVSQIQDTVEQSRKAFATLRGFLEPDAANDGSSLSLMGSRSPSEKEFKPYIRM